MKKFLTLLIVTIFIGCTGETAPAPENLKKKIENSENIYKRESEISQKNTNPNSRQEKESTESEIDCKERKIISDLSNWNNKEFKIEIKCFLGGVLFNESNDELTKISLIVANNSEENYSMVPIEYEIYDENDVKISQGVNFLNKLYSKGKTKIEIFENFDLNSVIKIYQPYWGDYQEKFITSNLNSQILVKKCPKRGILVDANSFWGNFGLDLQIECETGGTFFNSSNENLSSIVGVVTNNTQSKFYDIDVSLEIYDENNVLEYQENINIDEIVPKGKVQFKMFSSISPNQILKISYPKSDWPSFKELLARYENAKKIVSENENNESKLDLENENNESKLDLPIRLIDSNKVNISKMNVYYEEDNLNNYLNLNPINLDDKNIYESFLIQQENPKFYIDLMNKKWASTNDPSHECYYDKKNEIGLQLNSLNNFMMIETTGGLFSRFSITSQIELFDSIESSKNIFDLRKSTIECYLSNHVNSGYPEQGFNGFRLTEEKFVSNLIGQLNFGNTLEQFNYYIVHNDTEGAVFIQYSNLISGIHFHVVGNDHYEEDKSFYKPSNGGEFYDSLNKFTSMIKLSEIQIDKVFKVLEEKENEQTKLENNKFLKFEDSNINIEKYKFLRGSPYSSLHFKSSVNNMPLRLSKSIEDNVCLQNELEPQIFLDGLNEADLDYYDDKFVLFDLRFVSDEGQNLYVMSENDKDYLSVIQGDKYDPWNDKTLVEGFPKPQYQLETLLGWKKEDKLINCFDLKNISNSSKTYGFIDVYTLPRQGEYYEEIEGEYLEEKIFNFAVSSKELITKIPFLVVDIN
tara:strand:- start:166 stop:2586 length:2421 start_codon:yes stop_codon:yes gene_type:complete